MTVATPVKIDAAAWLDVYLRKHPEEYARLAAVISAHRPAVCLEPAPHAAGAEDEAFVDELFGWLREVKARLPSLSGYVLVWYAKTHAQRGTLAIAELIRARLGAAATAQIDAALKAGWAEEPRIRKGAWKARSEFKAWCRARHGARFNHQLRTIFPPSGVQAWPEKHERHLSAATQYIVVFVAWLAVQRPPASLTISETEKLSAPLPATTDPALLSASNPPLSRNAADALRGDCLGLTRFALRTCLAEAAARLERDNFDAAVELYSLALSVQYTADDVSPLTLRKMGYSSGYRTAYYKLDTRHIRLALASLYSRRGRAEEALGVMKLQMEARLRWDDIHVSPLEVFSTDDCWVTAALARRAGDYAYDLQVIDRCEGAPPGGGELLADEKAFALAASDDPAAAIVPLYNALVEHLSGPQPRLPSSWAHLSEADVAARLARELDRTIHIGLQEGSALRLGDAAVVDNPARFGRAMPVVVFNIWRLVQRQCADRFGDPGALLRMRWRLTTTAAPPLTLDRLIEDETGFAFSKTRFVFDVNIPDSTCFDVVVSTNACHVMGALKIGDECLPALR